MTDLQLILIILGTLFAFLQITVAAMGLILMSRPDVNKVNIGPWTGVISAVLFIAAVLV